MLHCLRRSHISSKRELFSSSSACPQSCDARSGESPRLPRVPDAGAEPARRLRHDSEPDLLCRPSVFACPVQRILIVALFVQLALPTTATLQSIGAWVSSALAFSPSHCCSLHRGVSLATPLINPCDALLARASISLLTTSQLSVGFLRARQPPCGLGRVPNTALGHGNPAAPVRGSRLRCLCPSHFQSSLPDFTAACSIVHALQSKTLQTALQTAIISFPLAMRYVLDARLNHSVLTLLARCGCCCCLHSSVLGTHLVCLQLPQDPAQLPVPESEHHFWPRPHC